MPYYSYAVRICEYCGADYSPKGARQQYCTTECQQLGANSSTCVDCGISVINPTSWGKPPTQRCTSCHRKRIHDDAVERSITAIQEWVALYGEIPSSLDWNQTQRKRSPKRLARYNEYGPWPSSRNLGRIFGSWNKAIEAAGFVPRRSYNE